MLLNIKNFLLYSLVLWFLFSSDLFALRKFYNQNCKCNKLNNKINNSIKEIHQYEDELCKWERPKLNLNKINKNELALIQTAAIDPNLPDYAAIDPWSKKNKKILKFNLFIFRNTILPFIYLIDAWVPKKIQNLFLNFTYNFLEPKNYIIYKLTGEHEKAKICGERFVINTFLGGGGLINVASEKYGSQYLRDNQKMDYVFYKKHINKGRFIVFPFINSYFEREFAADLIEWFVNPIFYFTFPYNYLYYICYKSTMLTDKKDTLFYNRKYDEGVYNNLRDLNLYEVSNYE